MKTSAERSCLPLLLGSLLVGACLAAPEAAAIDLHINPATRHQRIEGWGTSLWNATSRDPRFRQAYRDAGLNIVRLPMAKEVLVASSTDYATPVPLGSDLQANVDKMNFRPNDNVRAMAEFAQWLSQNAMEPDRVQVSASPWTPPHWMKGPTGFTQNFVGVTDNHPTPFLSNTVVPWRQNNPIPNGASVGGRLRTEDPEILPQYGEYLAAWVTGFEQEYGVPISVMSLQNESTFENPFDSMTFRLDQNGNEDFSQYAAALKSVKDAWESHGVATKVMGPHVAHLRENPGNPFGLRWQNEMIDAVRNHADPELIDLLDYYNGNYYNGLGEGTVKNVAGFYHGGDVVAPGEWTYHTPRGVKQDGKPIWFSETGGARSHWTDAGDGESGAIAVALRMHDALVYTNASAYVYWQFSDDDNEETQHNLVGRDHLDNPLASKKYAAFNQFTRFVRPGAERVDALFDNGQTSTGGASEYDSLHALSASAYVHDADRRLSVVLINMEDAPQTLTLHLDDLPSVAELAVFRSSATESLAELAPLMVAGGAVELTVPPRSVVTLVGAIAPEPGAALLHGAAVLAIWPRWRNKQRRG